MRYAARNALRDISNLLLQKPAIGARASAMIGGTRIAVSAEKLGKAAFVTLSRQVIQSDEAGFVELTKLHSVLDGLTRHSIFIDFSNVASFHPTLIAPLIIMCRQYQALENSISFRNLKPLVRHQFNRHKIINSKRKLTAAALARVKSENITYFGLKEFGSDEVDEFANYSKSCLDRQEMPAMTESLKAKFFEGIDELFANSAMHSGSMIKNAACGIYDKTLNTLTFAFADGGIGIRGAYEKAYGTTMSAQEAISWAMTTGNTTRQGNVSGGLGLKILREFIRYNGGRISIVSREGLWSEHKGRSVKRPLRSPFPGTIVTIEINTLDDKSYDFAETDPSNIW